MATRNGGAIPSGLTGLFLNSSPRKSHCLGGPTDLHRFWASFQSVLLHCPPFLAKLSRPPPAPFQGLCSPLQPCFLSLPGLLHTPQLLTIPREGTWVASPLIPGCSQDLRHLLPLTMFPTLPGLHACKHLPFLPYTPNLSWEISYKPSCMGSFS